MPKEVAGWDPPKQKFPVKTGFRFFELRAMKEFNKSPEEWALMPKACRAECIAFISVDNAIQNYQAQEVKKKK